MPSTEVSSKQEQHQRDQLQWVQSLLVSAQKRSWYGTLTIEIKRGVIGMTRVEETLKDGQLGLLSPTSQG